MSSKSPLSCLDTSILSYWIKPLEKLEEDQKEKAHRVKEFIKTQSREDLIIPAPVLAEALTGYIQEEKPLIFERIKRQFRIVPFDFKCAFKASEIFDERYSEIKKKQPNNKQKIKVDFQIIATAKANNAEILYTEDKGMLGTASIIGGIRVSKIPQVEKQISINFS